MQFEMQPRAGSCAQPQCLQTSPRSLSQCQCRREEFRFHIVHLGADSLIRTKIKGRNRKNWNKVFLLNLVRKPWRTDKSNTFLRVMPPVQLLPQMLPVTSVWPRDRTHDNCTATRAAFKFKCNSHHRLSVSTIRTRHVVILMHATYFVKIQIFQH